MAAWDPGHNIPAISRGANAGERGGQQLCSATMHMFGNVLTNCSRLSTVYVGTICAEFGCPSDRRADAVTLTAWLCGMNVKTARGWKTKLDATGWQVAQNKCGPAVGGNNIAAAAGANNIVAAEGANHRTVLADSIEEVELPAVSDSDDEVAKFLDEPPSRTIPVRLLEKWQCHPQYRIGMNMAEVATCWLTNSWSKTTISKVHGLGHLAVSSIRQLQS